MIFNNKGKLKTMQFIEKIGYRSPARIRARIESIDDYPFHIHDDSLEILCVLDGSVDISDSAATYRLRYGDVHMFNRNDAHRVSAHQPNILLTTHIDLTHYEQYIDQLEHMYFISDTYEGRDNYISEMRYLRFHLAKLYTEYSGRCSDIALEKQGVALLQLLVSQFRDYVYKPDQDWTAYIVRLQNTDRALLSPVGIYKDYERMYRIVDYVSEHFREKLTLRETAQMEFLSEAHLSRYMKETLGMNFSHLVSLTRCEETARLLSTTNKTIDQIAKEVGFSDRKHLTTHFRRWYHKTPTEYRHEIQKGLSAAAKATFRPFDFDYAKSLINMYLDEY